MQLLNSPFLTTIAVHEILTSQMSCSNMKPDMSNAEKQIVATDRKQQILQEAIEITASEGYEKLMVRGTS